MRLEKMAHTYYEGSEPAKATEIEVEERLKSLTAEIKAALTEENAIAEAKRCMSCGLCFDCGTCWSLCQDSAVVKPLERGGPTAGGPDYKFKLDFCNGCKKCAENCPCGYIEMH